MAPRPVVVHPGLTWHRVAALESAALMRATNAQMRAIIVETRAVIDDSREVMRRTDALLLSSPFVAIVGGDRGQIEKV